LLGKAFRIRLFLCPLRKHYQRLYGVKAGGRKERINRIAGYRDGQLIAPFTIEGSCNRVVFETWLETCLIPRLKPVNLVVIDNASFHHGGRIKSLIEAAGCNVMYLPPYSPDLNRIETCWAWIKSRVRKLLRHSCNLREAIDSVLKQATS
jgi:transposase